MNFGNLGFFSGLSFYNMKLTSVEVEKKLDDPNSTLEDLLIEEEVIQELKNQNSKLIKFFTKEKIKSLINYIIKEPKEDNQLTGHKFPFVASELLNCDEQSISDFFLMTNNELKEKEDKEKIHHEKNSSKDFSSQNINDILNELHKEKEEKEEKEDKEEKKEDEKMNEYPIDRIELLDYFLSFVETESELNYVLCGYFSKFLIILFNKKPITLINYFFNQRKDILEKFIFHSYRKSIADLLSKFLLFENYQNENNNNEELFKIRKELIEKIFLNLKVTEEREKISSIVLMLTDLFETKKILNETMENENIFTTLFSNLKVNLNLEENLNNLQIKNNYSEILSLLTFMISNSDNISKPKLDDNQKIIHTNLSENILNTFDNFIDNYNQKEETFSKLNPIKSVFNESEIKPLGIFRVKIIEFFSSLFPYFINISNYYDELLIKSNFFETSFNYLFKYEWNNIFQLSLLSLFKNYLKDGNYHIELSKYLFENLQIINMIKSHIFENENNKFKFTSNNKITHGYYPFLISLSYKINSVIGGIPLLIFNRSREGSINFVNRTEGYDFFHKFKTGFGFDNEILLNENKEKRNSTSKNYICESMQKYVNDDWNEFFKNNISDVVKLYENKLCEIKNNLEDEFDEKEKEDDKNPFEKEDNFFNDEDKNNINEDNFFNNQEKENKENKENMDVVNIDDFEFIDEIKNPEKEEDIKNQTGNLLVDEIDNNKYNDANFFKVPFDNNYLEEALKDLD